ncbi:MAG: SDR family NAD(P)-dependent oxidoreductase [Janthinobacterium lividum]
MRPGAYTGQAATAPVAVVTGSTSGIGSWIALGLAEAGYRLILIGRDSQRLQATQDWIVGRMPDAAMSAVVTDLSLLGETRRAADQILAREPSLDLLVNNAGILSHRRIETVEGHELTLAVNHLTPFVLTQTLLPALRRAHAGRIVMTGSSTSDRARIDPDNLELRRGWRMTRAYARSKLASLMTSFEIAGQLAGSGTTINVVHPGMVATDLVRSGGVNQFVWKMIAPFSLTAEAGADTPLYACLSPEMAGISGRYLKRRALAVPNRRAADPLLCSRVLAATERLV